LGFKILYIIKVTCIKDMGSDKIVEGKWARCYDIANGWTLPYHLIFGVFVFQVWRQVKFIIKCFFFW